jgi:hypothetical protein
VLHWQKVLPEVMWKVKTALSWVIKLRSHPQSMLKRQFDFFLMLLCKMQEEEDRS